jgi:hypothetical protein
MLCFIRRAALVALAVSCCLPAAAATPAADSASSPPLPSTTAAKAGPASNRLAPGFQFLPRNEQLVIMPIDVELFSLSAGGLSEPKADWTAAAQEHMRSALLALQARVMPKAFLMSERDADDYAEQVSLHAAVATSISLHHARGGMFALPTKEQQLRWNVGDAMQPVRAKTGARYGLFVWVRDSYASVERKAAMVAMALFGVISMGGMQTGYASLVDLQTGDILWFNQLLRVNGDLREAESARETIQALLQDFPALR